MVEENISMNFHLPVEVFDTLLLFVLAMAWNGYRRMWRHVRRLEKFMLMVLVMLKDRGFRLPEQGDTDRFLRSNNIEGI